MRRPTPLLLAPAAVAALAAAVALPSLGTGQTAGRDITVRERPLAIQTVDAPPRTAGERIGAGDRLVTRQALFSDGGARLGTLFTDCVGVGPTAPFFKATLLCTVTYRFRDGSVVATGAGRLQPGTRLAIVGGSGAYRSATGEVELTTPIGEESVDVLHLDG